MQFQAHKGVSTEAPENTMPAFELAVRQGYDLIELDVGVTADRKFVLLHDNTINRTGRDADGNPLVEEMRLSDLTYEEARKYDFGVWFGEQFRGTRITLLEDVLNLAQGAGIRIKLDNKFWRFSEAELEAFFTQLKPYGQILAFTCEELRCVEIVNARFPESEIHYDGPVTEQMLGDMTEMVGSRRLVVWLPLRNSHTSWAKGPFADEKLAALVRKYARLGIWILSEAEEYETAVRYGADILETNGEIKPVHR